MNGGIGCAPAIGCHAAHPRGWPVVAANVRDRVTIDLRGLGAAQQARAKARQLTAAALARAAIAAMLREESAPQASVADGGHPTVEPHRVIKVTVRLTVAHAVRLATLARAADESQGAYLASLIDGLPPPIKPPDHTDLIVGLAASTTELAAVASDINAFMRLLTQDSRHVAAHVQERWYRFAEEIRDHLSLASATLSALRPARRRGPTASVKPFNTTRSNP